MSNVQVVRGKIPAEEFALCETLQALPDVRFEAERVVQSGEDIIMPLIWVRDIDPGEFEAALEDDSSVREFSLLSSFDDEALYRMEWISQVELVLQMLANSEATIMDAYGQNRYWDLRVLYPDQESLTKTTDYLTDQELTFDITAIREMEGEPVGRFGLTKPQFEALTTAHEMGYFKIPREADAKELSNQLDISHQALSERLRRAEDALIEDALIPGTDSVSDDDQ